MKAIFILLSFVIMTEALSQAKPVSMKGQADLGYTLPKQEIQVPNKQYTNTGGLSGLIEIENDNLLSNPGFEASTYSSGWTLGGTGTHSAEVSTLMFGLKAAKVITSSQTLSIIQDSTLYASQFATSQPQGYVRAWIYNTAAGATLCARSAGVTLTGNNCVTLLVKDGYVPYEIGVVLGGTSNGLEVSSPSTTGTTIVDRAYVGVGSAMPEVAQAQLAGESYFAGTTSCTWSRTSATVGAFTSTAACPGPTIVEQNLGSWQTTDSDLPRQTINNLPAGKYKVTFYGNITSAAGNSVLAINDGTTTCQAVFLSNTNSVTGASASCVFSYTSSGSRVFELYGASSASSLTINSSLTSPSATGARFILEYYPPASKVYSQPNNVDTDWVDCGLTTADFTGFGTVSNIEDLCKKDGADLLMRVKFVSGTSTATEARVNLRLAGTALTSANSTIVPTLQIAGVAARSNPSGTETIWSLIEPSVAYSTFGVQVSTSSALTKINGSSMIASGATLFYSSRIPIAGWTKSQITGTFKDVVVTPGAGKPKDCSAKISSAGVISDQLGGCFASCTNATTPVCTFNTGYWASGTVPNCWHSADNGVVGNISISATTFSGGVRDSGFVNISSGRTYFCKGIAP